MKSTNLINSRYSFLLSFVLIADLGLNLPSVVLAQGTNAVGVEDVAERFSTHDPESNLALNHDVFTKFLEATVIDVGRSKKRMGTVKPQAYRESHITFTSGKPSRYRATVC